MTSWEVSMTLAAEDDVKSTIAFLKRTSGTKAAATFFDVVQKAVLRLEKLPLSSTPVRDERLAKLGYRWLPIKNHLMFITIDENARHVYVERILYGSVDWRAFLGEPSAD